MSYTTQRNVAVNKNIGGNSIFRMVKRKSKCHRSTAGVRPLKEIRLGISSKKPNSQIGLESHSEIVLEYRRKVVDGTETVANDVGHQNYRFRINMKLNLNRNKDILF